MNLVDNWIEEVISIERVNKEEEMYFLVTFIDSYGRKGTKKLMSIKNLDKVTWMC